MEIGEGLYKGGISKFQASVLKLVSMVPRGRVTTYKELSRALGRPNAYRAVGNALAQNPHPMRIPCHRVVRSDGKIGGYKLGTSEKARLLLEEGVQVEGSRVELKKYIFKLSHYSRAPDPTYL